jgi:hypothetical protein
LITVLLDCLIILLVLSDEGRNGWKSNLEYNVATEPERITMSKQTMHRFHMERFNLKKLNEVEGKEQYGVNLK